MNEFARKALELADAWAVEAIHEALAANTGKISSADGDAARAALVAHLEGVDEQDPELLEAMQESNKWHFVDDVVPILKAARAGEWAWYENTRCKYIELRIDMRDLGCIIRDREKVRISPATLAYQYSKALPATPTAALGDQHG